MRVEKAPQISFGFIREDEFPGEKYDMGMFVSEFLADLYDFQNYVGTDAETERGMQPEITGKLTILLQIIRDSLLQLSDFAKPFTSARSQSTISVLGHSMSKTQL